MDEDLHFFTIGAGALLNSSSSIAQVLGISQVRNSCFQGNILNWPRTVTSERPSTKPWSKMLKKKTKQMTVHIVISFGHPSK